MCCSWGKCEKHMHNFVAQMNICAWLNKCAAGTTVALVHKDFLSGELYLVISEFHYEKRIYFTFFSYSNKKLLSLKYVVFVFFKIQNSKFCLYWRIQNDKQLYPRITMIFGCWCSWHCPRRTKRREKEKRKEKTKT